jgi:hypothetical protein
MIFTARLKAVTKTSKRATLASAPISIGSSFKVKNTIFTVDSYNPNKKYCYSCTTNTGKKYGVAASYLESGVKLK